MSSSASGILLCSEAFLTEFFLDIDHQFFGSIGRCEKPGSEGGVVEVFGGSVRDELFC